MRLLLLLVVVVAVVVGGFGLEKSSEKFLGTLSLSLLK